MTTITLENVCKRFVRADADGEAVVRAVDNISLKIVPGQVLVILGPSGSGKTTLLRLIAGLTKPDSGQVLYDNVPLQQIPTKDRGIGMVFQEGALVPNWKSRRSVGFFLELRRREHELPERIERISEITGIGLEKLLDRRPGKLSGGEKQRVSIARALARDLKILLVDEPFANLDAKLRSSARVELKRLLGEFPVTTVYVTHDQVEAMALADRIAVMHAGKLEQAGTYRQLYDTPASLFMAGFIGILPINLFPGHIEGGRWYGRNFGGYPIRGDLPDGTPVTLGVRPEFVHLRDEGTPGVVERATRFLPERTQLVELRMAGERWSLTTGLDQPVATGATVHCILDPGGLLYFDTKTGTRIG
jgi:ABC-type sugar transport system ATPase subunit